MSWQQIMLIVVIGVFLLGPERIPVAVQWVFSSLRKVREMAQGAQAQLHSELGPEIAEMRRQIAELQSLKELQELKQLRDLNPKTIIGKGLFGADGEAPGGIGGFLGLDADLLAAPQVPAMTAKDFLKPTSPGGPGSFQQTTPAGPRESGGDPRSTVDGAPVSGDPLPVVGAGSHEPVPVAGGGSGDPLPSLVDASGDPLPLVGAGSGEPLSAVGDGSGDALPSLVDASGDPLPVVGADPDEPVPVAGGGSGDPLPSPSGSGESVQPGAALQAEEPERAAPADPVPTKLA